MTVAVWNRNPLVCPICHRHFPVATIRIVHHQNAWTCQQCVDRATHAPPLPKALTKTDHENLPTVDCQTCHLPLGHHRTTINHQGATVHYRCPTKRPHRR